MGQSSAENGHPLCAFCAASEWCWQLLGGVHSSPPVQLERQLQEAQAKVLATEAVKLEVEVALQALQPEMDSLRLQLASLREGKAEAEGSVHELAGDVKRCPLKLQEAQLQA